MFKTWGLGNWPVTVYWCDFEALKWLRACLIIHALNFILNAVLLPAESSVESVTPDLAQMKVSETGPPSSKAPADTSTSAPAAAKHEEDEQEETAEEKAKREAELQKIYADLAREDDR